MVAGMRFEAGWEEAGVQVVVLVVVVGCLSVQVEGFAEMMI